MSSTTRRGAIALSLLLIALPVSCRPQPAGSDRSAQSDPTPVHVDTTRLRRVGAVHGLASPESARYDPRQDVVFVTSINGNPGARDDNGYISRIDPDGTVLSHRWVHGGRGGVTLHAPKGLALAGGTLWVTDIDVVRGFDAASGTLVKQIDLAPFGAACLNDIVAAPDGSLYVTDSGLVFGDDGTVEHPGPDFVFRVAPDGAVTVVLSGDGLASPNGVAWDSIESRLLIAPVAGPSILAWRPGDTTAAVVVTGPGAYDGIEMTHDGDALVTSFAVEGILLLHNGVLEPVTGGLETPADLGYDPRRRRIFLPMLGADRLEIYDVR